MTENDKALTLAKTFLYNISGVRGFSLSIYMKAMKSSYDTFEAFEKDNNWRGNFPHAWDIIKEEWNKVEPLTAAEALQEQNQEKRRVLFKCIGPARLFKEMNATMIDRTVLKIKNRVWSLQSNKMETKEIDDVYELYSIPLKSLFEEQARPRRFGLLEEKPPPEPAVKAVRCWCTTTAREYWIFVQDPDLWQIQSERAKPITNAVAAIAWTFRVGIPKDDILEIYRQGDCLVLKAKEGAEQLSTFNWYHLDEETYKEKLVAQS